MVWRVRALPQYIWYSHCDTCISTDSPTLIFNHLWDHLHKPPAAEVVSVFSMGVFCRQGSIRMYSMTKSAVFSEATALSGCQKDTRIAGACCVLPRNPTLHVRHRRSLRIFSKDTHCAMHALHPLTPTGRWRCRIPSMGKRAGGRHISLGRGPSLWMGRGHASGRINPKLIIWTAELIKRAAGAVDSHIQNSVMLVFSHWNSANIHLWNPICPVFHKKVPFEKFTSNLCQAFGLSSFSALLVIVNVSRSKKLKTWVLLMKRSVDRQFCYCIFSSRHSMKCLPLDMFTKFPANQPHLHPRPPHTCFTQSQRWSRLIRTNLRISKNWWRFS